MVRENCFKCFLTVSVIACLLCLVGFKTNISAQEIQDSVPAAAFTDSTKELLKASSKSSAKASGKNICGKNLTWKYSKGTLTISGKGKMYDYPYTSYGFGDGSIRSGEPSKKLPWYKQKDSIKKVVIKKGVTGIGEAAFGGCSKLETVTIPASVTTVGQDAFRECGSLKNVRLPDKLKEIPVGMFDRCGKLQSVHIPKGVKSIGAYAFCQCNSLTSINLPDNLKSIGTYAFQSCAFKTINIPNGVECIDMNTFSFSSLEDITLPSSVKEIRSFAFYGCLQLSSVKIMNKSCKINDNEYTINGKRAIIYGINGSTAQQYAKKYGHNFTAIDCVVKVTLSGKKTVAAGKSTTIKANVITTNPNVSKDLAWSTSNKKYAIVNQDGKVTAKKSGKGKTVTITATAKDGSGVSGIIKIKIK